MIKIYFLSFANCSISLEFSSGKFSMSRATVLALSMASTKAPMSPLSSVMTVISSNSNP